MDPKKDVKKVRKVFDELIANKGDEDPYNMLNIMKDMFEEEAEEYIRANTEFPVKSPEESEKHEYIQLKELLKTGTKEPEADENGYCEPRPVFNEVTEVLSMGNYHLAISEKIRQKSNVYNRYIDKPAIIFREVDNKMILFLPREGESLAFMIGGLEVYTINKKSSPNNDLGYIYLMMNSKPFFDLFPEEINHVNILEGSIPKLTMLDQLGVFLKDKDTLRAELQLALDVLRVGAF